MEGVTAKRFGWKEQTGSRHNKRARGQEHAPCCSCSGLTLLYAWNISDSSAFDIPAPQSTTFNVISLKVFPATVYGIIEEGYGQKEKGYGEAFEWKRSKQLIEDKGMMNRSRDVTSDVIPSQRMSHVI